MIVKPDSADPGLSRDPIPIPADHIEIAKPKSRKDEIYMHIRAFIERQVKRPISAQEEKLDRLLALAEADGAVKLASDWGLTKDAVRALIEILMREGVGSKNLITWLQNIIPRAGREFARHTNEDEAFEAARREALRLFNEGKLTEASSALMEEFERDKKAERERQEEHQSRQRRLLGEAISLDELAFDGEAAAQKLRLMGEVEGVSGPDAIGQYLVQKADEFYERGDKLGENSALFCRHCYLSRGAQGLDA